MTRILSIPLHLAGDTPGKRSRERAAALTLVRMALGPAAVLGHDGHGAPVVENGTPRGVYISLSHDAAECVLAVDDVPVGIDVESARHSLPALVERVLTPAERAHAPYTMLQSLMLWTAKEAVFKCAGHPGLTVSQIQVNLPPRQMMDNRDMCGATGEALALGRTFSLTWHSRSSGRILAVATEWK